MTQGDSYAISNVKGFPRRKINLMIGSSKPTPPNSLATINYQDSEEFKMRWHPNTMAAAVMATVFTMTASAQMPEPKPEHEAEALLLLNMASKEARAAKLVTTAKGCIESKTSRNASPENEPPRSLLGRNALRRSPSRESQTSGRRQLSRSDLERRPNARVVIEARIDGGSLFSRGDFLGFKKKTWSPPPPRRFEEF